MHLRDLAYTTSLQEELIRAARDGLCIRVGGGRWPFGGAIKSNRAPIAAKLVGDVTLDQYRVSEDLTMVPTE